MVSELLMIASWCSECIMSGTSWTISPMPLSSFLIVLYRYFGKHGKIDPVGTDEIDPVKTA